MTISTTTNRVSYAGNGATTAFAFGYYFLADADLVVIKRNTSTGAETTQTLTTHYTVSGAGNPAGGTVTFVTAPSASEEVIIYRDPAVKQEVDLVNNDPLPVETSVEQPLDRLTMICQRLADRIGRALRLTDGDTSGATTTITPSADKFLGWNSSGTALENKAMATIGAVQLSDATPQALTGTGSAGTSAMVSRSDHKHASGTAATKDTGTSGNTVPLLDGANTWSASQTLSGVSLIEAEGADVASAATTNIWATDGNTRHITGTTTITSFGTAPQAGAWQKVIFDGVLTLTHSANLNLPGAANITTAAGDFAFVYADTTTQFDVLYFRADGTTAAAINSAILVHSGNGHGSTNTKIRRYTTTALSVGSDITYADSATLGASFTINTTGIYAVFFSDNRAGGGHYDGISHNSAALTTNIESLSPPERTCFAYGGGDVPTTAANVIRAVAGDVIRPHTDGSANYTSNVVSFSIRRVA